MKLEEEVKKIVAALEDRKAEDIRTYDVRGISGLCDAFVVATGTAAPHLKALATAVKGALRADGVSACRVAGQPDSGWTVADFSDVIVHVFSPEARQYYGIEKLWPTAKPVI